MQPAQQALNGNRLASTEEIPATIPVPCSPCRIGESPAPACPAHEQLRVQWGVPHATAGHHYATAQPRAGEGNSCPQQV